LISAVATEPLTSGFRQRGVVGVDIDPTDAVALRRAALVAGVRNLNLAKVGFRGSDESLSTLDNEIFDHAYSRDVFEHLNNPVPLLKSVYPSLKPRGTFFVQIWPLWHSEWGAHLFDVFRPWQHLMGSREEVLSKLTHPLHAMSYDSYARTSIEDLQRAFLVVGFKPELVELFTPAFRIPEFASNMPCTSMGTTGFKALLRSPNSSFA